MARLKHGDTVEVRSEAEILATLDDDATVAGMPFMPEMLSFVGKRFTVSQRVEKICDTISGDHGSRRMRDTVLLEDLRCDGSAHGGCQAGCRLYWKESWLRRVDDQVDAESPPQDGSSELTRVTQDAARTDQGTGERTPTYRCQATEALRASEPLAPRDVRQYVREVSSGNVGPRRLLRVAARGLGVEIRRLLGRLAYQPLPNHSPPDPSSVTSRMKAGDLVEVRTPDEIVRTLDDTGKTRVSGSTSRCSRTAAASIRSRAGSSASSTRGTAG